MALQPSQQLGPYGQYTILKQIGAGGMGEVYQAHDTKLGRDVAIKILPAEFAREPERLVRFQREARMLAALNHPNIATIHGLERSNSTHYLVMELVSGETLAERIKREGCVPVEEVLKIAVQIAEALEAAHEKGIIHRDLKPANVKVTPEGKVKVLDFGLAKAFAGEELGCDPSNSPTFSRVATMQGVILGTAAYMSPEQARGKEVDKRTDIWALGCLLYEMLTGKQAFPGEDVSDILAAVIRAEPNWQPLPSGTPIKVRDLLRRCLQKDKTLRLRDAGDVRLELDEALNAPAPPAPLGESRSGLTRRQTAALVGAILATAGISVLMTWLLKPAAKSSALVTRFTVALRPNEPLAMANGGLAVSPGGTYVAYTSTPSGKARQLFLRPMDQIEAVAIPGTDGAASPFFSPDGQWVAFTADGKLKKVPVAGGTPIALADESIASTGSWSSDGTIFFVQGVPTLEVMRMPAAGGTPQVVITPEFKPGELGARWPEVLPGGQAILYVSGGTAAAFSDDSSIIVQSLKTGERKTLIQGGTSPHYLSTGHLVYAQGGRLLAVPFNLQRLETTGTAFPVLEDVWQGAGGYSAYSLSRDGSLAYVTGGEGAGLHGTLTWVDRSGLSRQLDETPRVLSTPSLSPDGQRLAIENRDNTRSDIWILDLTRGTFTRLTIGGFVTTPVWTPDGKRVIYASRGGAKLMWRSADGTGPEEELLSSNKDLISPQSCSPDGQLLVFYRLSGHRDLWVLPLAGDHKARPLIESPFDKVGAQISPDGRWLAYASNETGRQEIFVQPFPSLGGKWQISTSGGVEPRWSHDGRQLFYFNGNKMMAVGIETKAGLAAGVPHLLFDQPYEHSPVGVADYDVALDGQHFLMLKPDQTQSSQPELRVVLNWAQEVTRRVPPGAR